MKIRVSLVMVALLGLVACGNSKEEGPLVFPMPSAQIFADSNRSGTIDFDDPGEAEDKTAWTSERGAIFLANIDDDGNRCSRRGSDKALAECNDASDEVVNGAEDLKDLARVKTRPWADAPDDVVGRLSLNADARPHVRLFLNVGGEETPESFVVFDPATDRVEAEAIRKGIEFAIEGKGVVTGRDPWDGFVDLTWTVLDTLYGTEASDSVRLRQAPLILRHHLDPAQIVYASDTGEGGNDVFLDDLRDAVSAAGLETPLKTFDIWDQWTQDLFENGYMAMPGPSGLQVIQVYLRSANIDYPESLEPLFAQVASMSGGPHEPPLREGGRVVYTDLRGPGVAGLTHYHPDGGLEPFDLSGINLSDAVHYLYGTGRNHQDYPALGRYLDTIWARDTLDSFGNTETIPPYELGDEKYPLGRIVRGGREGFAPDPDVSRLFAAQGMQDPLYVDTSWLVVSHIDETISFLKSDDPRGWSLIANDPAMAREMLRAARDAGHGDLEMFVGKLQPVDPEFCSWVRDELRCPPGVSATVTIAEVLDDPDLMAATARAAIEVDAQLEVLKQATGITREEIIFVPFLHEQTYGTSVAYQPGTVNGIAISDTLFGVPEPHGPQIDGKDIFKAQLEEAFAAIGVGVHYIENWDYYHVMLGEVHCGSNVRRAIDGETLWWEVNR